MSLIVLGLGNPGGEYKLHRHNVGFWVVESVAEKLHISFKKPFLRKYLIAKGNFRSREIVLVKPLTYMNNSGVILGQLLNDTGYDISQMLVVCDQLDLPPGVCRLRTKGSSGGHNGLASIIEYSGTTVFKRIYIGIGRPEKKQDIVDYVLTTPGEEMEEIKRCVERSADAILMLLYDSPQRVMNGFNKKQKE
ncbi:MAG: aminoacyl-tRNA hydrolase [Spirochaetales bacterium]|nr:aminoacyl-tRNA hydrolase [Spirochaetales bacterium]